MHRSKNHYFITDGIIKTTNGPKSGPIHSDYYQNLRGAAAELKGSGSIGPPVLRTLVSGGSLRRPIVANMNSSQLVQLKNEKNCPT